MLRNIVITDCKSFEDYELFVRFAEGLSLEAPLYTSRRHVNNYIRMGRVISDNGRATSFYHFWSDANDGTKMTMDEFKRKYIFDKRKELRKTIRKKEF